MIYQIFRDKINNILEEVVKSIYGRNYSNLESFLISLKPATLTLWQSYRNNKVSVNYQENDIQCAYFFRYYLGYVMQAISLLENLNKNPIITNFTQSNTIVTLIGSGPLPEALAICLYRHILGIKGKVYICSFDLNAKAWVSARNVTKEIIKHVAPEQELTIEPFIYDYTDPSLSHRQRNAIAKSSLVIFQNCFNEASINHRSVFTYMLDDIISKMSVESILAFSDFYNYETCKEYLNLAHLKSEKHKLNLILDYSGNPIFIPKPPTSQNVARYLLTGESGYIPSKGSKCLMQAFQKENKIIYKSTKSLKPNSDEDRCAIYIDTIFLNQAMGYAFDSFGYILVKKFPQDNWSYNINYTNLTELVPFLLDTAWAGLSDVTNIDVFAFQCSEVWSGAKVSSKTIYDEITQRSIHIHLYEVDFIMMAIAEHIFNNLTFNKYNKIIFLGNEPFYDSIISKGIQKGILFMRYRFQGDLDRILTSNVVWQDVRYPIVRMWGLRFAELHSLGSLTKEILDEFPLDPLI